MGVFFLMIGRPPRSTQGRSSAASDVYKRQHDVGLKGSATRILDIFTPVGRKENIVLTGAPKKIVEELFERFDDAIGSVIRKDLKAEK